MEANRAFPRAIWLSLGALISVACFYALLVGIAHLMPRFLSFTESPRHGLVLDVAVLLVVAGCFRKLMSYRSVQRRNRKQGAAQH
jgi:hypothetical protein